MVVNHNSGSLVEKGMMVVMIDVVGD